MSDLLQQNALADARDVCEAMDRSFVDSDLMQYKAMGVDLPSAAVAFVSTYSGKNSFVRNVLSRRLKSYGQLTGPQCVIALNIMREEHCGLKHEYGRSRQAEGTGLKCFTCGVSGFPSWDALRQHKADEHDAEAKPEIIAETGEAKEVLEVTTSIKGLDLSSLPDGRYAAPDPSGKNDHIFLMVKRVRHTHEADRRYRYGKIVTGREVVVAGTIEVREWSSDSKEWIGKQVPGDSYRGQYEDELELVMLMPEPWAILFGRLLGRCCRCGKALTDEVSRNIGLGLECEKYLANAYFRKPPQYTYVGADRPDAEKADPNDALYLSGQLNRYVKQKSGITGN